LCRLQRFESLKHLKISLARLQQLLQTAQTIEQRRDRTYSGKGGREETITPRLEPLVDLGILEKDSPFSYRYQFTPAGRHLMGELAEDEDGNTYLDTRFFAQATEAFGLSLVHLSKGDEVLNAVYESCRILASPLGYAPIREVLLLAVISAIEAGQGYFEMFEGLETLQAAQRQYPELIRFTGDRWGKVAFVKFLGSPLGSQSGRTMAGARPRHSISPDATFFVERLHRAVEVIRPWVARSVKTNTEMDPGFAKTLKDWAVKQGIANYGDDQFYNVVGSQIAYRFIGKVIFYETLRRWRADLPEPNLGDVDDALVLPRLHILFEQARQIDYQAIFEEEIIDRVPFPQAAVSEIKGLVADLNRYNFHRVSQDVIGQVYERLIPPEERHTLGQYFTREDLVDIILALCVRDASNVVLDPTCGSGTFLVRAYSLLQTLDKRDHPQLLNQLWGVDIARFPGELATINLFRQKLGEVSNFPRILASDFFALKPGATVRFPSPKAELDGKVTWVDEEIPLSDAIVGNFPYVRQEDIERQIPGYKDTLQKVLAEDWYATGDYRELFDKKGRLMLSGLADIYAYLFIHAARFLNPGGRMGIVTSNAWLDAGYGYELQRFLLKNFKVVAVLESRCEPWFDQVSVNTIVTVAERCADGEARARNPVAFIKVKRPLSQVLPPKSTSENYWKETKERLANALDVSKAQPIGRDGAVTEWESESFRTRFICQEKLLSEVERFGKTVKWGRYLRAPRVYFDLVQNSAVRLSLLRDVGRPLFGSKTRINEFFHIPHERAKELGIDPSFLMPLFKSPKTTDTISVDVATLPLRVFVCRRTKEELRREGKLSTLRYIEWGEQQVYDKGVQRGMRWPEGPWVRNRKPGWWALPENETKPAQIFFTQALGDRHVHNYSPVEVIPDARLYFLKPADGVDPVILVAVLNSSITALFSELAGRVTLGDGVLELKVEDARDYLLVPDVRSFRPSHIEAIRSAFESLRPRPIESVFSEVSKQDRQELDGAVLEAMGLDPDKYLQPVYDNLCQLVRERLDLAAQRKKSQKSRPQRDVSNVKEAVTQELLPAGPKRFPDDFINYETLGDKFVEVRLPKEPLRVGRQFFGAQEVTSDGGFIYRAKTPPEAKFLVYAQAGGAIVVHVPTEPLEQLKAVSAYEVYLRELRVNLLNALRSRTMNQKIADRLLNEIWTDAGLSDVPERG